MAEAAIGLGSNLGDKAGNIRRALHQLASLPDTQLMRTSRLYQTEPWGDADQDWFLNACAVVDTALPPDDLLAACLEIERQLGRDRTLSRRWGPRPIDLDVLLYAGVVMNSETLTLPHPRITERVFVLVPLADVAPDWQIEGFRVDELAARTHTGVLPYVPA